MTDVFDIRTPEDFFKKLLDERHDLETSHDQSTRHALNAILTACHLTDWVWQSVKGRGDLHRKWNLSKVDDEHFRAFIENRCPLQRTARLAANGAKHAKVKPVNTHVVDGAFDPAAFSKDFDVPYLSIVGEVNTAFEVPDFLDELIKFWRNFLTIELGLTVS